jgi:P27 family predicted phage terminase small subunit
MTQRLSPGEKRVRGTSRPDRAPKPSAMQRLDVAPLPPDQLSEGAKAEWSILAPVCVELGVLTGGDLRALELMCEILGTETELRALLKNEGYVIAGAGNNSKGHPAVKLLESTRSQAARMLSEFGLTPKGRQGVDIRPRDGRLNSFLRNGKRVNAEKYFDGPKLWEFDGKP